jgi:hypothetical protein
MNSKKYCPIHCFNYSGSKCPFCEQERVDRIVKKYTSKEVEITEESKEITQESLDNLLAKFNSK